MNVYCITNVCIDNHFDCSYYYIVIADAIPSMIPKVSPKK